MERKPSIYSAPQKDQEPRHLYYRRISPSMVIPVDDEMTTLDPTVFRVRIIESRRQDIPHTTVEHIVPLVHTRGKVYRPRK